MNRIISFLVVVVLALTSCASPANVEVGPDTNSSGDATQALTAVPTSDVELYKDPAQPVEVRANDLLSRMSLEEKIGQMTQVEKGSIKPGDITKYYIGSILSGGGGSPAVNTPQAWYKMVQGFQDEALKTRLGIPIVYGVDAVHGHGNLLDATFFPQNVGLGATNDPLLVEKIGRATAEEMLATGITWNFAPVVAVPQDVRWGRLYEGYSESTAVVTELGAAYIRGLQTVTPQDNGAPGQSILVLATPKHYIGDGGTIWGSSRTNNMNVRYMLDQGNVQVSEEILRELYLPPYQAAVDNGAKSVMASFSSWKTTKMHANYHLLTEVLKGELGFEGFVVSDWQAIDQIDPDYYTSVVTAINAGVDMNMVPYDYAMFIDTMKKAVMNGDIPQSRVDDAVRRILIAKFEMGLFESPMPDPAYLATVRSEEHLAIAREAVQKSMVLLVNKNEALPLKSDTDYIFVSGNGADDIGLQSGGWTLQWQGQVGNASEGSTLLDGIKAGVDAETQVIYRRDGDFSEVVDGNGIPIKAGSCVVALAEKPYAEGVGDKAEITLSKPEVLTLTNTRPSCEKLVVVLISGRPLVITGQLDLMDALVAAWLPGSEGAAMADVLFGKEPFTGKLAYTWPRSLDQLPITINNSEGKAGCDAPLFPFGYGLALGEASPDLPDCPSK